MTAVTAVTAQNTTGVSSVIPVKPAEIRKQILFTCKDIKPNGIKIGMLHSSNVIISVVSALKKVKTSKIVLDPVMVAKGGARLINKSAIKTLKDKFIIGNNIAMLIIFKIPVIVVIASNVGNLHLAYL